VKILITCATTAAAYKLKNTFSTDEVFLGDYNEVPAFTGILKLPNPSTGTYAHEMLTLCLDKNFNTIYLLDQQEAEVLSLSETLFNEYDINIINAFNNL
jgi:hypothetical protein